MFRFGTWELVIIFAITLLLFGAKRLPSLATGLGLAIRNFKDALEGESHQQKLDDKNSTEKKA